jgi:hypothetical protein
MLRYFFKKYIYFLKSNLSLTRIKFVNGSKLHDFWYEAQKKAKNMLEITVYKAGMTWQFGGISGCHTSWMIYGRNISST